MRWDKTNYHCPGCGKQEVYSESGEGDYYLGQMNLCILCGTSFYDGVTLSGESFEKKKQEIFQSIADVMVQYSLNVRCTVYKPFPNKVIEVDAAYNSVTEEFLFLGPLTIDGVTIEPFNAHVVFPELYHRDGLSFSFYFTGGIVTTKPSLHTELITDFHFPINTQEQ